jgi:hypothetical protein
MKRASFAAAFFFASAIMLFANGGAWQTGIPGTGTASASTNNHSTDVEIQSETLKIDLQPEYAAVEVHYRMHNTGPKAQQDFFFPVERWGEQDEESGGDVPQGLKPTDIGHYQISVDGKELKWTDVPGSKEKATEVKSGALWDEHVPVIKSCKKSVIPFERDQTHEVIIHYGARYSESDESVSDDSHISDRLFAYSLSPAATWKGPIAKGVIDINILHPEPEDVSIEQPKDRFKKISDTHYQWSFENLKPSLADDIRIIAHSKYDEYPTGYSEEALAQHDSYVLRGNQYFLDHTDYDAKASSTLAAQGKHNYDVINIKADPQREVQSPWAEGVEGDGIGESITLDVKRALPLYGILIRPGYYDSEEKDPWLKNNRVASLEITLNDEQTFTETIPDERFEEPYLIRVRNYTKPVKKVKLVIKAIHHGTEFHDTCISLVRLRAALATKPEVNPAR